MANPNVVTLNLHADALAVLDAVAAKYDLRGRSEAVRQLCAALAPTFGCGPVQVVRVNGRPPKRTPFERRKGMLRIDELRALPDGQVKDEWVDWYNLGRRPSPTSVKFVESTWGNLLVEQMLTLCTPDPPA